MGSLNREFNMREVSRETDTKERGGWTVAMGVPSHDGKIKNARALERTYRCQPSIASASSFSVAFTLRRRGY